VGGAKMSNKGLLIWITFLTMYLIFDWAIPWTKITDVVNELSVIASENREVINEHTEAINNIINFLE